MTSRPTISLACLPASASWAHHSTTAFADVAGDLVVQPVHGLVDHQVGLCWDVEEVVASVLLNESTGHLPQEVKLRVLPPLRSAHSPYRPALFSPEPEDLRATLLQIARGIKQTGARKLAFLSTNPWNSEIVDVASRDIRIELNLQTFVVELGGLGLSLHPRSADRGRVQALASHILGQKPENTPSGGAPRDIGFRPGNWMEYPPLAPVEPFDAEVLIEQAGKRLAGLWSEIADRAPLENESIAAPAPATTRPPLSRVHPVLYPIGRRSTYLPALTMSQTELLARQNPLVIIPVGAIEQHGPHLPVGVDSIIAESAAEGLARRLGDAVCFAPTLNYGKSNEHHDFPGTIDLGADLLQRSIITSVRQMHKLGFRQFAILNTHGGNSSVLVYTSRQLQIELGVRIGMLRLPGCDELSEQERTWGFHAGEWETSVMLAIAADTVLMDRAICHYPASIGDPGELRPENAPAVYSWKTRDIAPDGVMGDATRATVEKGRRWFEAALDEVAESIRSLS